MNSIKKHRTNVRSILLLCAILLAVRTAFIMLMPATYSKDLYGWLTVIDALQQGKNPYMTTTVLNWPPFWMTTIYCLHSISKYTNISVILLIQSVLIAGELATMALTYIIIKKFFHIRNLNAILITAFALNPICILLSCQHCNFDVFVGMWILLFTYTLLEYFATHSPVSWLMACFFLGMGIYTKTVPLILSPLLLTGIQKQKATTAVFGLLLLFIPVVIGMSIIFSLGHEGVINNVLNYRSMPGWYGITGIFNLLNRRDLIYLYRNISPAIILCGLIFVALRVSKLNDLTPRQGVVAILLLLVALPTFGPGYSPPYIDWFLPLLVIFYCASGKRIRKFLIAGYIITALTYITEYAFFDSHGAFMLRFIHDSRMLRLSNVLGSKEGQDIIRLPMFLCYLILSIVLARDAIFFKKTIKKAAN